jgi:hypothetical protein
MYTPCKTNVPYYTPGKANFSELYIRQVKSDLYTLQDKLFRIIHPARRFRFIHLVRKTFQINTAYKANCPGVYTLQDKGFRIRHLARQAFQIYTPRKTIALQDE